MLDQSEALKKADEYIAAHYGEVNKLLYPNYHVAAPIGWINDPNGFCYALGKYHIFYQYYPYDSKWGPMHWGHATSDDLIHWDHQKVALAPSEPFDYSGCFSGSAIEHDNKLYLFYTGHAVIDPVKDTFKEVQAVAVSEDGINFKKLGVVIEPEEGILHFRDPKVFKDQDGLFHMIFGKCTLQNEGEIHHYTSTDLLHWTFDSVIKKMEDAAFMYECPDFFEVEQLENGKKVGSKWILATSPMGQKPNGFRRQNTSVNSWQMGDFDGHNFTVDHNLVEVDFGHDFYATQSALSADGRRILLAWMSMWRLPNMTYEHKWAGALTLPREIFIEGNHIYQRPVKEAESLRIGKPLELSSLELNCNYQTIGNSSACELLFKVDLAQSEAEQFGFALGHSLRCFVDRQNHTFTVFRTDLNATSYRAISLDEITKQSKSQVLEFRVFIDNCSVEIFINGGAYTFTSDYFGNDKTLSLYVTNGKATFEQVKLYKLDCPMAFAPFSVK